MMNRSPGRLRTLTQPFTKLQETNLSPKPVCRLCSQYLDLGCQFQTAAIQLRAGFMPPKVRYYGPLHRPFTESIFSRGFELAEKRREFEMALGKRAIAEASNLSKKIGVDLASRIAI